MSNESKNQDSIQEKSIHISEKYHCQTGILTPFEINEHGLYLIFYLKKEIDDKSLIEACKQLPELKKQISNLNVGCRLEATLGFGFQITQKWFKQFAIPIPRNLLEFKEKKGQNGKVMPSTGGDLFVHIRSNRKDLCFELGLQFRRLINDDLIDKLDETFGFAYMSSPSNGLSKDFIGFEDGVANPKTDEQRANAALINEKDDEEIHVGGSYALTQKWKHNLIKWNQLNKNEQEKVIGRTKGENSLKVKPLEKNSHLVRTDLKDETGHDIKVLRQSLPYGGINEHGLFFVSYASNPLKHEKQLNSMIGIPDEIQDQLMNFTTPITGNYWFIPSIRLLTSFFKLI